MRRTTQILLPLLALGLSCPSSAQLPKLSGNATPAAAAAPQDPLGRNTPRDTVMGFLSVAHKQDFEGAAQYLNAPTNGTAAASLAEKLFVVLDRRLPPKLTRISDKPEGSQRFPAEPNIDLVGTVDSVDGPVAILVERVERSSKTGPIWLFSRKTLDSIPALYEEVQGIQVQQHVPAFLRDSRFAGISLFQWLAFLIGLPLAYGITALIDRALSAVAGTVHRRIRRDPNLRNPALLAGPLRLLILAGLIRIGVARVAQPLLARQIWSAISVVIMVAGCVWLLTKITALFERIAVSRFSASLQAGSPLLRFGRRATDILIAFIGIILILHYFGVNTSAALAGLGVGGIAVALAAQKTLENVIGGLSIIFDGTIKLGDSLKVGDTVGTVDAIGLRSTRIRTLDRTMVSLPNGQVAIAGLENLSARDKFRFLHTLGVDYHTTVEQMRRILAETTTLLAQHPGAEAESVRVRFLRLGDSSLDIEVFAYLFAQDWNHFLEIQQELLLNIMGIVEKNGASIAFPSRTLYFGAAAAANPPALPQPSDPSGPSIQGAAG